MINITKTNGIIQITTDGGLPKSYFNSNVSFTANSENLMFYIKINGDYYEVPLATLEISGTSPSSLPAGISSLATLFTS